MKFIYDEVRNGIFNILIKEENPLTYTELYTKLNEKRERRISDRDFSKALADMVQAGELKKTDTGRRGAKVFYSLTDLSKEKHQLLILGEGEAFEKRRQIYHLILYYEVFKRTDLLTKNQLARLLKKIDVDYDDISKFEKGEEKYVKEQNDILINHDIRNIRLLGYPKGIAIGEYLTPNGETQTQTKKDPMYYVVVPGFTVEEFVTYIEKLRKRKEPKPFTNNTPLVPYVYYTNYTKDEIIESIGLLQRDGLIEFTPPIFKGEIRYVVSDERLLRLFSVINKIHIFRFGNIVNKICHLEKPNDDDKYWLRHFFGERNSNAIMVNAHGLRKAFLKDNNQKANRIKEIQKTDKELEEQKNLCISQLHEEFGEILNTNPLLKDLIISAY